MDPNDAIPPEDVNKLAGLLADFDDALARGVRPEEAAQSVSKLAPEVAKELSSDLAVVARLRRLWPGPPLADIWRVPDRLSRFHLMQELGRGGSGVVYLALDPLLNREVAVKVPRPEVLVVPELRGRFLREARAAASLSHPNLVTVFESGEDGLFCYLVSEYCPGGTLAAYLRERDEPLPPRDAAEVAVALADAVDHAHQRGVLHRDVKPSNVLLEKADDAATASVARRGPRLADFGLAQFVTTEGGDQESETRWDDVRTHTGAVMGTPAYMAPEQVAGHTRTIAAPTDVHGLGTILYETLTGQPPFGRSGQADLAHRVLTEEPVPLRSRNPRVPRDLEAITLRCLEKRPERRYPTATALAADLRRYLNGEPTHARPRSVFQLAARSAKRRPGLAVAIATVVLALLLLTLGSVRYTTRLRDYAGALEGSLTAQRRQAAELDEQRRLAEERADEAREQAYVSDIARVARMLQDGRHETLGELLNRHRPRAGESDNRGFEWHHLWHRARADLLLRGHRGAVYAVAASPDGRFVASAGEDGVVRVWDVPTARLARQLTPTQLELFAVTVSADGRLVAAAGRRPNPTGEGFLSGRVHVWDTDSGDERFRLDCPGGGVNTLRFSPDGRCLAAGGLDGCLTVWGFRDGQQPSRESVTISQGLVWVGFDGDRHTLSGVSLAAHPELPELVGRRWAVPGLRESESRPLGSGPNSSERLPASIAVTSRVIAVHDHSSHDVLLWGRQFGDTPSRIRGKLLGDWLVYSNEITGMALSDDGRILTAAISHANPPDDREARVQVWNLTGPQPVVPRTLLPRGGNYSRSLAFTPDGGRVVIGCQDGRIHLWEPAGRPAFRSLAAHEDEAWGVTFSPDGKTLVTTSDDHTARTWDVADDVTQGPTLGHLSLVTDARFSPNGETLATACFDGYVRLWRTLDWKSIHALKGHLGPVRGVAWSPDGATVASVGDDQKVHIWDAAGGELLAELRGHTRKVHSVSFAPDGKRLVTAGSDSTVRLWDVSTARTIRSWTETGSVLCAEVSPDGTLVAVGTARGVVKLYRTDTGDEHADVWGHRAVVRALAFSPDGRTLASAGKDQQVKLWHVRTGQELLTLKGHEAQVNGLAFHPDGRTLASSDHSGAVLLWGTGSD